MPIDRSTILRGPAVITFQGQTFYFKDDIRLALRLETFDLTVDSFGRIDERVKSRLVRIAGTPSGVWAPGPLSVLFPYANAAIGSSLFSGVDQPLTLQTLAGQRLDWKAAAVTRMPSIHASAVKTLLGPVEFTCLGANNTPWGETDSMVASAATPFSDNSFTESGIITAPFTASWGTDAPWASFQTRDGFAVTSTLAADPVETDADGVVDLTLRQLDLAVRCTPLGVSEADLIAALNLQGAGAMRGFSLGGAGRSLTLANGAGPSIAVASAALKEAGLQFGVSKLRAGECLFVATRTFTSGAPNPLFLLA